MDPLISAEELALYLGRTDLIPDVLALAVASASGIVRDWAGWSITRETTTFVVDGSTTSLLSLPTLHLNGVTEVRVAGEVLNPSATGWTSAEQYTWSARGQLFRACGWPCGFRSVEADVDHGYDIAPDAVRAVVFALAAAPAFTPGGSVLLSKTVGAVTHTYRDTPSTLTDLQAFQLSGYRLS